MEALGVGVGNDDRQPLLSEEGAVGVRGGIASAGTGPGGLRMYDFVVDIAVPVVAVSVGIAISLLSLLVTIQSL